VVNSQIGGTAMLDVVTLGETMVLFSPDSTGSLKYVNNFKKQFAGAESNFAIGITRFGHSAGWISKIGNDPFGNYLIYSIRGEGVDTSRVKVDREAPTGLFFKELHELMEPKVYYYRAGSAASKITPNDLDEEYIASSRILHLTGITPALSKGARQTLYRAIEIAKKHNVTISFDPNIRKKLWPEKECKAVLLDIIKHVDILLPGLSESKFLLDEDTSPEELCKMFLDMGPKIVAMKLGKEGCIVCDKGSMQRVRGIKVENVIDPIGAGDAFGAGFISGILKGWSLYESGRLACDAGAFVTTVIGDIEGMPTLDQIREFRGEISLIDR
jgi:2-dehydro-3-deoxygluconokinase